MHKWARMIKDGRVYKVVKVARQKNGEMWVELQVGYDLNRYARLDDEVEILTNEESAMMELIYG